MEKILRLFGYVKKNSQIEIIQEFIDGYWVNVRKRNNNNEVRKITITSNGIPTITRGVKNV